MIHDVILLWYFIWLKLLLTLTFRVDYCTLIVSALDGESFPTASIHGMPFLVPNGGFK